MQATGMVDKLEEQANNPFISISFEVKSFFFTNTTITSNTIQYTVLARRLPLYSPVSVYSSLLVFPVFVDLFIFVFVNCVAHVEIDSFFNVRERNCSFPRLFSI